MADSDPYILRLGKTIADRPGRVLAVWLIAIACGVWGSQKFPAAALGGSTGLHGSDSRAVSDALRLEFDNPLLDPLLVVASSPGHHIQDPDFLQWDGDAAAQLRSLPEVREVLDYASTHAPALVSADGHETVLVVGLAERDLAARQHAVPRLRSALAPFTQRLRAMDPQGQLALTGAAAADYDINTASAEGGDHAEKRALPLTLFILLLAFGTPIAALLPFLMGVATTMVALGLAYLLAQLMPVSNLLGNVVTMVGLAVGIDYSLLLVKDYRERRRHASTREALAASVAAAGVTIAWSGSTVAIGLLGLLFSPILETRSVGIGGSLVVVVSVLAALTLLPAVLALIGDHVERWPLWRGVKGPGDGGGFWAALAAWTVRRPVLSLMLSGCTVVALALPSLAAHSGFSDEPWFLPRGTESRTGAALLEKIHRDNSSLTVQLLVRTTDASPVLAAGHLAALTAYADRLRADARVAGIVAPWTAAGDPALAGRHLSRDGRAALVDVTPAGGVGVAQAQQLARDLKGIVPPGPFTVTVGGPPAYYNDFTDTMGSSLPKVFGFVILATLVLLFLAFRSYLLPLKAVLANLLAIGAGYGVVVAIFQFGWMHTWIGLERPFASVALEIPLMIFCLSFGLSMDYELFLLKRIQAEYARHGDNERAIVAGLAAVAPVITGAGLIMAVVFGAFVGADLPALKMIGVGLCTAVLIDATLIRGFVVPAVMSLAGRWNWYPGRPGR